MVKVMKRIFYASDTLIFNINDASHLTIWRLNRDKTPRSSLVVDASEIPGFIEATKKSIPFLDLPTLELPNPPGD